MYKYKGRKGALHCIGRRRNQIIITNGTRKKAQIQYLHDYFLFFFDFISRWSSQRSNQPAEKKI